MFSLFICVMLIVSYIFTKNKDINFIFVFLIISQKYTSKKIFFIGKNIIEFVSCFNIQKIK